MLVFHESTPKDGTDSWYIIIQYFMNLPIILLRSVTNLTQLLAIGTFVFDANIVCTSTCMFKALDSHIDRSNAIETSHLNLIRCEGSSKHGRVHGALMGEAGKAPAQ